MMDAYLIDPEIQRISTIALPDKHMLDEMRRLIGAGGMDHRVISDEHDAIWVDDLGLTRSEPVWGWKLHFWTDFLAGKGVVIGADDRGLTRAPYVPIGMLQRDIRWLGKIIPEITWVEDGETTRAVVTYTRAN